MRWVVGNNFSLWVVANGAVYYKICDDRAKLATQDIIGQGFDAMVNTDRYGGNDWLCKDKLQFAGLTLKETLPRWGDAAT